MFRFLLLVLLATAQVARADLRMVGVSPINGGNVVRNPDMTISSSGETLGDLVSYGVTGAVLSFAATDPAYQYSFPDGTVYDYAGGTFFITGTLNATEQVLFSGDILSGQGWTENEHGDVAAGPMLIEFYADSLDSTFTNPALSNNPIQLPRLVGVSQFQVNQSYGITLDANGHAIFHTDEITTTSQATLIPSPEPGTWALFATVCIVIVWRMKHLTGTFTPLIFAPVILPPEARSV